MAGAYIGYPQAGKYKKAKERAENADVNTLPDPKTYAFVSGLLGTPPGEQGFSVLHPDAQGVNSAGDAGYRLNLFSNLTPVAGATKGLPVGLGIKPISYPEMGARITKKNATVVNPERIAYPGIYGDPRDLVAEATYRVAPESPMLKRLFGVTRDDLWNIGEEGMRKGNVTDRPFKAAANPKGAEAVDRITNPKNTQRIQDLIGESMNSPALHRPMASWYVMDPLYKHFERLWGPERAVNEYKQFNALTGMSSPGSEVLTELNRGTGANWLAHQGRFDDFLKYAGIADHKRGANFPNDMRAIQGHAYHKTSQAPAMQKYLQTGKVDMGSAKVPSYIMASGTPETGFQSNWMVSDAHHSRIIGLPDVRGARIKKGEEVLPNASASVPEVVAMQPWWENQIAAPTGHSSVGAQGVVWGAGSGATGVTSPIGAPKLELLATQIEKAAKRMGVSPERARDMIIMGQAHAGNATPEMLGLIGGGLTGGLLANEYLLGDGR